MAVNSIQVREFSAFEEAKLTFTSGINVFIGENGTGKTHVLKLIYAMLESARKGGDARVLAAKLAGVFRPDGGQVGRLVRRRQGLATAIVKLTSDIGGGRQEFTLHKSKLGGPKFHGWAEGERSVFLPSREILALYEGFIHAYTERELSFDETYYDACVALNANPARGVRKQAADEIVSTLREALGGHSELHGDRFYVKFSGDRALMEAHLVAEGLRKIASLERLVLNGMLTTNGFLFWDEPEANLNPRLTVVVADLLGLLAKQGVQVFVTTHDFLLARRLSASTAKKGWPATQFFGFFRPQRKDPVKVEQGGTLEELAANPISEQFARQYEFEAELDKAS
ncbi:MAG: AAA family ATPase [Deltaproteobacteria bacterium]|nr:AAA family ATPase [Deltaproteobacteria bacterium]